MPGAIDTNGIYQYAEDDVQPTFSDLLNLLAGSTSDSIAAHYASLASQIAALNVGGLWTNYTPTITGITSAYTVATARYLRSGPIALVQVSIALSAALALSGDLGVTMPWTISSQASNVEVGRVTFIDTSAGNRYSGPAISSGGSAARVIPRVLGTNGVHQGISPTLPFTFASGDFIHLNLTIPTL